MTDDPVHDYTIDQLLKEVAALREQLHYAKGTCDLAMQHRDAAEATLKTLRKVSSDLVDVLVHIEADKSFQGIWGFLQVHDYRYTGPTWDRELVALRAVLAQDDGKPR